MDDLAGAGDGLQHASATPDVCKTPSPGGPVPVPYPNLAASRDLAKGSKQVKIASNVQRIVTGGRAAMFEAIEVATAMLDGGVAPLVLVAAVDSLVDTQTFAALANANRLASSTNLDSYMPGEAAACVLLGTASAVSAVQVLATIVALARAHEPRPFDPTGIATAEGLAAVFRALRCSFDTRVDEVFAAVTTERYYAQEFAHAYLRNVTLMPEPLRSRSIAAALGDLGAAAGAVALVHAVIRVGLPRPGNRDQPNAASLIYASGGARALGGCVLMSPHHNIGAPRL